MGDAERIAIKAACVQAAAALLAPSLDRSAEPDTEKCARYAADLYSKLTLEAWRQPPANADQEAL